MRALFAIALAAATLMLGVTLSLMSSAAVAHHNASHSLGQCGLVVCPGTKKPPVPRTTLSGR